jgi:hypothetical protein
VEARRIDAALRTFHETIHPLPGIQAPANREAFLEQVMESIHRVRYVARVLERDISARRADPASDLFDPIKAAAFHAHHGRHDEACWLVFLSVHFGKSLQSRWRYPRDIYGALGGANHWDWARVSANPAGFRAWLAANQNTMKTDGVIRRFGNHRKYESLDDNKPRGTGAAVQSYVAWVGPPRTHAELFRDAVVAAEGGGRRAFAMLYRSMKPVISFGRTAKFDYLTMIGKLGLAPIEPGSIFTNGATGPLKGARLLFFGSTSAGGAKPKQIDSCLVQLEAHLGVGVQVLEDSLCNWQKSPAEFRRFRG